MGDYYDLGNYSRSISTTSPDAQIWFDRGLIWNYAYHHEEAVECFNKALEYDPSCVMAHWGIAYAIGPNYNKQWGDFEDDEKENCLAAVHQAVASARNHLHNATAIEKGLIKALAERYPDDVSIVDFGPWNDAFANAMRKVYQQHPDDMDIATIFAESIMNRTPWKLWDLHTGKPAAGADTVEAIEVLETAFSKLADQGSNRHPGLRPRVMIFVPPGPRYPKPACCLTIPAPISSRSPRPCSKPS